MTPAPTLSPLDRTMPMHAGGAETADASCADDAARAAWRMASAVGSAAARAGRALWRATLRAVRTVDPDVRRHAVELPLVGLSMLVPSPRVAPRRPSDGRRPVIFVHGLAGHPGNFALIRAWFGARGRTRTWSLDLRGLDDVDVMAARLQAFVIEVLATCDEPDLQVDVVAHSLGGLVARRALADPGTASKVARWVTLGTPHQGTWAARFADGPLVRGLRPGATDGGAWPSDAPPLTAMWSEADVLVVPATAATVEGATNVAVEGVTHYGFLARPRCFDLVMSELER